MCRYQWGRRGQATDLDFIRLGQAQKGLDRVERAQRAAVPAWMPASTDCLKGEDASSLVEAVGGGSPAAASEPSRSAGEIQFERRRRD